MTLYLSSQISLLSANRAKPRTFHYWRTSNEWVVKYPPFWLPLDIKKLLSSDSVITDQKFRASGCHVTQISTWQRMLLARLAAEKQEMSCKTLLKLENNSLKGVWSTIQILQNYYGEKTHAWVEGRRGSKENATHSLLAQKDHSQVPAASLSLLPLSVQRWQVNSIGRRQKFQMCVYNCLQGPGLCSEKTLASPWIISWAGQSFLAQQ